MISTQAHWSQLEELTGVAIGDVKTITLGKIFSMELSQYGEDVDEIVVCAINELKIEKEIYSIEKCWCGRSVKNELEQTSTRCRTASTSST